MSDIAYFEKLWQDSKPKDGFLHTKDAWDERALKWTADDDVGFSKVNSEKRRLAITQYLREKGLLDSDKSIIDIGCGPGLYACEFARTADFVIGTDISQVMLDFARQQALKCGADNTAFIEADFASLDLKAHGFENRFDLVFASLTPAISGVSAVEKMMELSRSYCFNTSFVYRKDRLRSLIFENVLGEKNDRSWNTSSVYCLFNILWQMGCYPEVSYYEECTSAVTPVTYDLAQNYAQAIFRECANDETAEKIYRYFLKIAEDGAVKEQTQAKFGWLLWKVS